MICHRADVLCNYVSYDYEANKTNVHEFDIYEYTSIRVYDPDQSERKTKVRLWGSNEM